MNDTTISNQTYDEERALYGSNNLTVQDCRFDGPADGESALKESHDITAINNLYNLRYPFWHNTNLKITGGEMTDNCRAALWYSSNVQISNLKMHGIKAVRECENVMIEDSDINSPEFGWFTRGCTMKNSSVQSEYIMMRSDHLDFKYITTKGKYSFQYSTDSNFVDCTFETKDAFWHGKNTTIRNCIINGEYLAWYSENLTFEHCTIIGTQPFCYCKGLKLIDCKMIDTDLAFEKSEVEATITTPVMSVKNPYAGYIKAPSFGKIIIDDEKANGCICKSQ